MAASSRPIAPSARCSRRIASRSSRPCRSPTGRRSWTFATPPPASPSPSSGIPWPGRCAGRWSPGRKRTSALRALDGRELEANISAAPLRDREPDGRIVGAVSVLRDVTWRKQLEREREAAREQAERDAEQLDRIFEAVADGLARV